MKYYFYLTILLLATGVVRAFSLDEPRPLVTVSSNGGAFFVMAPEYSNGVPSWTSGKGNMFILTSDGSIKALWSVTGWYSHKVVVSNDGLYVIRLSAGPLVDSMIKKPIEPLVSIYREGGLFKSFTVEDFGLIETSDLYAYKWLNGLGQDDVGISGQLLYLVLCNKTVLRIDLNTGVVHRCSK